VIVVFIMMEPLADIRPESFAPSVKYPSRRWARFSGTSYSRMIHGTHDPGRRSRIFPAARLRTMAGSSGTGRPHDGLDRPSQIRLLHQVVNAPDNLCRLLRRLAFRMVRALPGECADLLCRLHAQHPMRRCAPAQRRDPVIRSADAQQGTSDTGLDFPKMNQVRVNHFITHQTSVFEYNDSK
jgi:hypothetical protein